MKTLLQAYRANTGRRSMVSEVALPVPANDAPLVLGAGTEITGNIVSKVPVHVLAAFHGLTHENMTRNFGWSFLDLGRRLQRASNVAELILGIFGTVANEEDETGSMLFVLDLADSFITYRSRYRLAPLLPLVLDLLLIDESNPRSVAFQLEAVNRHIGSLPQSHEGRGRLEEQRLALALFSDLQIADVAVLAKAGTDGKRQALMQLLERQKAGMPQLSEAIAKRYFNLVEKGARWVRARSRVDT